MEHGGAVSFGESRKRRQCVLKVGNLIIEYPPALNDGVVLFELGELLASHVPICGSRSGGICYFDTGNGRATRDTLRARKCRVQGIVIQHQDLFVTAGEIGWRERGLSLV